MTTLRTAPRNAGCANGHKPIRTDSEIARILRTRHGWNVSPGYVRDTLRAAHRKIAKALSLNPPIDCQ